MSISQEVKSKVRNDWLQAFPELTAYSQINFYKIAGAVIYGVEIIKSSRSDRYRPFFDIYPLWKNDVLKCMKSSFLFIEIENKKNLQFNIPYNEHEKYFEEAVFCTRKHIQMPFEGNVPLKSIYKVIEQNAPTHDASGIVKSYILKLHLLLYLERNKEIEKLLREIEKNRQKLLGSFFEHFFGSFDVWFQNLKESLSDRDKFLKQIEINKQDKKLQKMIISEIID